MRQPSAVTRVPAIAVRFAATDPTGGSSSPRFDLPEDQVATMDFGLVYTSVAEGDECGFAVVFGTDGRFSSTT